jgi:hypothetical protein
MVFIYLRAPPLLGFCLGRKSNFVDSESGRKQSGKLLQHMVSNTTQHPFPATRCLSLWEGERGGGEPERRLE